MVALPQIRCELHDNAKQYDNDGACHNNERVESCMAMVAVLRKVNNGFMILTKVARHNRG